MVKKRYLLLIASLVWLFAGLKVLSLGLEAYKTKFTALNVLMSLAVFIVFWLMVFNRLVNKHTVRIKAYTEEKRYFWNFFDLKSFIIMAIMMTGGILIRKYSLLGVNFIAFFYTGIGAALSLAGLKFMYNFIKY
ncbi:hypothetical protein [Fenollaria sporofastidiosus]|uniref:hypothetical protein n=1 Tax=Fenollaria sporofastidiosus TaxID=2811778 RepID=UPI001C00299D|nr:hypothetical protein [Fenollaria sporofastidiosus]